MGFVLMIRKRSWDKDEAIKEYPTESIAIKHADTIYYKQRVDTVAVVTIDPDTQKYIIPYKITRKCKHKNVQEIWAFPTSALKRICVDCKEEILPINIPEYTEVEVETGRHNRT